LFFAVKFNAVRHLLIVLLVPDRRAIRNLAAAVGLALAAVTAPSLPLNAALPVVTALLLASLYWQGRQTKIDPRASPRTPDSLNSHGSSPRKGA
jgi:hypothetical protein